MNAVNGKKCLRGSFHVNLKDRAWALNPDSVLKPQELVRLVLQVKKMGLRKDNLESRCCAFSWFLTLCMFEE